MVAGQWSGLARCARLQTVSTTGIKQQLESRPLVATAVRRPPANLVATVAVFVSAAASWAATPSKGTTSPASESAILPRAAIVAVAESG
jgi:hypothetical protein